MGYKKVLSSKFNMSLGFIPVIISILLCEVLTQDIAIYIGTVVGILFYFCSWRHKGVRIPQIILYSTTGILLLFSIISLFTTSYCPHFMVPFTLEISAVIPPLIIFLNRKRFLNYHAAQTGQCCKQLFAQSAEAAIVSTRVVLIISLLHLVTIFLFLLFSHPLGSTTQYILFNITPAVVFILTILFNQFGILYFNITMQHTVFVPVVNKQGDVIGKVIASEAINKKSSYINPVIRIAVVTNGMLFLIPRPQCSTFEKMKADLLMEGYLLYNETLEEGANRILQQTLPTASLNDLHFSLKYHFENEVTNRLIYLFTLDLDDDSILCNKSFKGGKLWTFQQIEHNLDKNFFSYCFEYEYEHLKSIICTREKYKEF